MKIVRSPPWELTAETQKPGCLSHAFIPYHIHLKTTLLNIKGPYDRRYLTKGHAFAILPLREKWDGGVNDFSRIETGRER